MDKIKKNIVLIILILIYTPVFGHYHWVSVKNYNPDPNEKIEITLSSGHSFPKSGFLLSKMLIFKTRAINSEKTITACCIQL